MWNQPARVSTGIGLLIFTHGHRTDRFIGLAPPLGAARGSLIGFSPRGPSSTASPDGGFPAAHRSRAEQKRVASTNASRTHR